MLSAELLACLELQEPYPAGSPPSGIATKESIFDGQFQSELAFVKKLMKTSVKSAALSSQKACHFSDRSEESLRESNAF